MAQTQVTGKQVKDGSVQRDDLDASTAGQAVVRKLVQGAGVSLTSTGADAGTGDVTVATPVAGTGAAAGHVTNAAQTIGGAKTFDSQYASGENDAGDSGSGTKTIDWNDSNCQRVRMTGNCTFAFSNPIAGGRYALRLVGDGSAVRTPSWPASVIWSGGAAPTLSGASKGDIIVLYYTAGGNYWSACQPNFNSVT